MEQESIKEANKMCCTIKPGCDWKGKLEYYCIPAKSKEKRLGY